MCATLWFSNENPEPKKLKFTQQFIKFIDHFQQGLNLDEKIFHRNQKRIFNLNVESSRLQLHSDNFDRTLQWSSHHSIKWNIILCLLFCCIVWNLFHLWNLIFVIFHIGFQANWLILNSLKLHFTDKGWNKWYWSISTFRPLIEIETQQSFHTICWKWCWFHHSKLTLPTWLDAISCYTREELSTFVSSKKKKAHSALVCDKTSNCYIHRWLYLHNFVPVFTVPVISGKCATIES